MKNKHKKLLLVPLFALLLAGCNRPTPSVDPSVAESSDTTTEVPTTEEPSSVLPSSEELSSEEPTSKTGPGYEGTENYRKVENGVYSNRELDHAIDMTALTSVGEQKILVVPVVFNNTIGNATPENHEMINKVFFGASEETGWESVASYYHKSSFGKLTLTGEVLPYFNLPYSTNEFGAFEVSSEQKMGEGYYWDQTHHIIRDIYDTLDAEKLKEFDQDGDGHVDALWMVYMNSIRALGIEEDPFWAYKFYWNRYPNVEKPTPNVYAWASYNFAKEGKGYSFDKPDAHTFIHETGHLLGLPDYYDYDQKLAPSGGIDMMDRNVIDHNIYSKFRLNWASPYYVEGHSEITLRPSAQTGDFILIKDGWNGHAYDEYVVIEYYTPTVLNEKDSTGSGYVFGESQSGTKGFTIPGVRMYHVDSRLITYKYAKTEPHDLLSTEWSDEIVYDDYSYTRIGPSNTGSRSSDSSHKLLHLLNGSGRRGNTGNWLKSTISAFDDALFQTGTTIDASNWIQYFQLKDKFNDGVEVGYSVTIGEMTPEGVKIIINKA